ncbi:MAG TPA: adenylate cyclase regulatory domain-containing protein [Conexibacter sp.]|jgi:adenylate cyclase|nr:adenylate cyclase regulatory domain-containing protein [Conexibacter sp.]
MDFAAEGLLDGLEDEAARADRIALLEELLAEGVAPEELKRAVEEDRLVLLRVERVLGAEAYTPREVAAMVGIDVETALRHRQALGLPRPGIDERALGESDVEALTRLKAFQDAGLPEEGLLDVTRVLGEGLSRVAATLRPMVRDAFLRPAIGEHELSTRYAAISEQLGPQLGATMQHILDMHLRDQLRNDAIGRTELASGRMTGATEVTVAFADLVGFTKLGEQVPAEELGAIAGRLGELATEVTRPPVRLVKTIGDAAMLVSPEAGALVDAALELVEAAERESDEFPRLRAGLATGPALGRAGDWYGSPVNLASRITNVARPGSVVVADATREAADGAPIRWSPLPARRLKGVDGVVPLFRARPAEKVSE